MKPFVKRYGSTALTILGAVGLVATALLAVKATPKAMQRIDDAEENKGDELTKWETVQIVAPIYIPSILMGTGTMVCIFGANVMNKHQQASLMSAYALVDQSYKKYQDKLKELYGDEAHEQIIDAIAAEESEKRYIDAPGLFTVSRLYCDEDICGKEALFYYSYGERYFKGTLEQVMAAEYHLNRNYVLRGYVMLNEFFEFLGLDPTDYGEEVGWNVCTDEVYWIDFNHRRTTINGQDCYVIETEIDPHPDLEDYY